MNKANKKIYVGVLLLLLYIFPLIISLINIFSGSIAFWYDPARDLFSGLANLNKLSLIGPPSGIPGIFYAPYWIWSLSIGLVFSHDPRVVAFVVLTIPYFAVLPFVLFRFSKIIGYVSASFIWILFILNFNGYATQIWNPHLAPLFVIVLLYLLVTFEHTKVSIRNYLTLLFAGIIAGMALHFHISFGLGLLLGTCLFLLVSLFRRSSRLSRRIVLHSLFLFALYCVGIGLTFLPFLIFEYRHGFQQIQIAIQTLTAGGAVVGQVGLSKLEIVLHFIERLGTALAIPFYVVYPLLIGIAGIGVYEIKRKRITLNAIERKFLLLLTCISCAVLFVYGMSKNPVWDYHFISVEVLWLFFLALLIKKSVLLRNGAILWIGYLILVNIFSLSTFSARPLYTIPTLATKEYVVTTVLDDTNNRDYTVYIYNPAIYTYDYSYLFQWLGDKEVPYDPGNIIAGGKLVYIILPEAANAATADFIEHRTPGKMYKTTKEWKIPEGTTVLRREKIAEKS